MLIVSYVVLGYLAIAAVFGFWFVVAGAQRLDASARGASVLTRLLWYPAASLLWPLLIVRLLGGSASPAAAQEES